MRRATSTLVELLPGQTYPLQDFCGLRHGLKRIVERDVDTGVKRAIRHPCSRGSALGHADTICGAYP